MARDAAADVIQQLLAKVDLAAAKQRSGPAKDRAVLPAALITRIDLREAAIGLVGREQCILGASGDGHDCGNVPGPVTAALCGAGRGPQG